MKNLNKLLDSKITTIARMLALTLFVLCGYASIYSQQNGASLPGVSGESNQAVSLYTGRLNVNIPLAKISGRGESGVGLNLLNKRAADWQVVETLRLYHPTTNQLQSISYAAQASYGSQINDYSPMSLSFQASIGLAGQLVWDPWGPMSSYLVLTTSEGNKVNFRDSLRDGEPTELNSHTNNGPLVQCVVTYGIQCTPDSPPPAPPPNPPSYCSRGKVFHSTDGSGMTFVSDNDVYDAHNSDPNETYGRVNYFAHLNGSNGQNLNMAGYLYLPNGTKYRIKGGKPIAVIDRNGNTTAFNYIAPPNANGLVNCDESTANSLALCRLSKVTDSLKREIVISYGVYSATVTCSPKITPGGRQESNRIKKGDSCYEEGTYGRADSGDNARV